MLKRINFSNIALILAVIILLIPLPLSYADYGSFTVNVPNAQGGYTAIVLKQSGDGYIGPQGEYYSSFPSVVQLQNVYGLNAPNSTGVVNTDGPDTSQTNSDITVTTAPPELPVYVQPEPPDSNYIWTPGYWAYDSFFEDYYWVPGTWVMAPSEGLLWTPGYWYWRDGRYVYSNGYWGQHIGFYGGINYGHGYEGTGFSGGNWNNGVFINRTDNIIINNTSSFNGGPGGTNAKPTFAEQTAMNEKHIPPTLAQKLQVQAAIKNPVLRASINHGTPAIAATVKPGAFKGNGVVAAKQAGIFYNKTKPTNTGAFKINQGTAEDTHMEPVQQNKAPTYVPKMSNEIQAQRQPVPLQKRVQQGTNKPPQGLSKEQVLQKQKAALKAEQEKKKREQQLLQEQQAQSSNVKS